MANKLPWFTHDHDAHQDVALRSSVRKHGHVAGWVYWCTLELLHKHGVGDTLEMPLVDIAHSMMVDKRVCKTVYETLCSERLLTSVSYEQKVCAICTVVVKKFRERQSKLKIKIPRTLHQDSFNTAVEEEREREREGYMGNTPKPRLKPTKFTAPESQDVVAYCQERKNKVDPQRFIDHYAARGWMIGKNKMKDWKAAVRTWEKNDFEKPDQSGSFQGRIMPGSEVF